MHKFTKIKKALAVSLCSTMLFSGAPKTKGMDFNNTNSTNITNSNVTNMTGDAALIHSSYLNKLKELLENCAKIIKENPGMNLLITIAGAVLVFVFVKVFCKSCFKKSYNYVHNIEDLKSAKDIYDKVNKILKSLQEYDNQNLVIKDALCFLKTSDDYMNKAKKYKSNFLNICNFINVESSTSSLVENKIMAIRKSMDLLKSSLEKIENKDDFEFILKQLDSNDLSEIEAKNILDLIEEKLKKIMKGTENKDQENKKEEKIEVKINNSHKNDINDEEDKKENDKEEVKNSIDNILFVNNSSFKNLNQRKNKK